MRKVIAIILSIIGFIGWLLFEIIADRFPDTTVLVIIKIVSAFVLFILWLLLLAKINSIL